LSDAQRQRFTPQWIGIVADEIGNAGPLAGIELLARSSESGGQRFRYRFNFRDENFIVSMTLGATGTIEGLGLSLE